MPEHGRPPSRSPAQPRASLPHLHAHPTTLRLLDTPSSPDEQQRRRSGCSTRFAAAITNNDLPAHGPAPTVIPAPHPGRAHQDPTPRGGERWGPAARSSDRTLYGPCSARGPALYETGSADRMPEHGRPPSRSPAHPPPPRPLHAHPTTLTPRDNLRRRDEQPPSRSPAQPPRVFTTEAESPPIAAPAPHPRQTHRRHPSPRSLRRSRAPPDLTPTVPVEAGRRTSPLPPP